MRESKFDLTVVDEIAERLALGEPLAVICRSEPAYPSPRALWGWTKADADTAERIARAREAGFDVIAGRTRLTARGERQDPANPNPLGGESTGDVQRDKLIIETDLKLLAKWDPRRYGDLLKMTGADGQGPIALETNAPLVSALMGYLRGGALPTAQTQEPIDVTPRVRVAPIEESESRLAKAMGSPLIDSQGDGPAGASPGQGGTLVGKRKAAMRSERIAVLAERDAVRAKVVVDKPSDDGAAWDLV